MVRVKSMKTEKQRLDYNQQQRDWVKLHPKYAQYQKEYQQKRNRTIIGRFQLGKYSAKEDGREWSITLEEYTQELSQGCFYCGESLIIHGTSYSLDRIDNNKGYSKDNVLPCCKGCNYIKNDTLSVDQMQVVALSLMNYNGVDICEV